MRTMTKEEKAKKAAWDALSDQERHIPKCKPCMAVRRATKERGFGPIYCMDCDMTVKTSKVFMVEDKAGNPLYLETEHSVEKYRPCRKCGKEVANRYRFCNDCHKLDSEMDDFVYMDSE